MLLLVYIGMMIYGVFAGYLSSFENENEHQTVAVMVFIAMLASLLVLPFGHFAHIFSAFFLWLLTTFLVSEGLKFFRDRY
ncbi:MAG: hypothetical protein ACOC2X_03000 [Bacillota bacterium]